MIVRCERCSRLYELDETLLAPGGSEVQCSGCQHRFVVYPPQVPGRTVQGIPAADSSVPAPQPLPGPPARPAAAEPSPSERQPARAAPGRAGPTVYRPPISQPTVTRPPLIRRDTVGTFESRLRWSHRWRWLGPTLFLAAAAVAVGVFLARESTIDPRAREAHAGALELALRDDRASLEQAAAQLDQALRQAPSLHAARADRALVSLLLVSSLGEGGEARQDGQQSQSLSAEASSALENLAKARLAPAEVARARAVAAALNSERDLKRLVTAARGYLGDDPFVASAEQSVEVRSPEKARRERALTALGLLVSRRPDALRARYLLARAQAAAGKRPEALATLEGLLRTNPRHEGALALRESLEKATPSGASAAPPVTAPAPVPPAAAGGESAPAAARAEKPATLPRKVGSTGGEPSSPSAAGAAAASGEPAARPRAKPGPASAESGAAVDQGTDHVPGDAEPSLPSRLHPAPVPEPEPVQGGG